MSRRMTRSETMYVENPTNHFKQLIKNPKISTSTTTKIKPVKRNLEVIPLENTLKTKRVTILLKSQGTIDQVAADKPPSSIKPSPKHVENIMSSRVVLVPIESTRNSDEPIKKTIKQSQQDTSATPQSIDTDQNKRISSRRKTMSVSKQSRSGRLKNTSTSIYVHPMKTVSHKPTVPIAVNSITVEIPNNDNIPLTSTKMISNRRKTQTDARNKLVADQVSRLKLNLNYRKVEIIIPIVLKKLLISDAHVIKCQRKCYKIPGTQNVAKIVDDYVALKQSTEKNENDNEYSYKQIFGSIIEYFDALLGIQLLFESERIRHLDVMYNFLGARASEVYTPIYLLRLFVQLNPLIEFSKREAASLRSIVDYVNEFANYLAENQSIFSDMINFN